MVKYNKEKHMLLEFQNLTKSEVKTYANKESRSLNNFINIAIEEKIKRIQKEK